MIPIASLHLDWAAMAIGTIGTILWAHGGPALDSPARSGLFRR